MERATWWALGGAGVGAGLMYLLDPRSGHSRRVQLQQQARHATHEAEETVGQVARDMAHRTQGLVARRRAALHRAPVEDAVLEARVRAALGRVCSHPHALHVHCHDGRVALHGPILRREHARVLARARKVRGVHGVEDHLEAHAHADGIPDLQGGVPRQGARPELLQRHWSPSARFLATLGGAGLLAWGVSRRGGAGAVAGLCGLALASRALTNRELKRLVGIGARRHAIELQKTLTVNAPVEEVYAFWSAMENFPRFMSHVHRVHVSGERSHWEVHGPGGLRFTWDAVLTQRVPNQVLAWKSVGSTLVQNAGFVRFRPVDGRGTLVDVRLSYNPPAGALGHAFARVLGADPRRQMDDDLLRFKSLLERGKATGHETVTQEELAPGVPVRGPGESPSREP